MFHAHCVSVAGTNTAKPHDFFAQDGKGSMKMMPVPGIEQGHVQADVLRM